MTNTRKVQQAEAGLRELESKRAETESSSNSKPPPRASPCKPHKCRSPVLKRRSVSLPNTTRRSPATAKEQALVLELTDAFTQWTNNRLALNAARASRLIRQAELERALAAYTF